MESRDLRVDGTWAEGSSEAGPPDSGIGPTSPISQIGSTSPPTATLTPVSSGRACLDCWPRRLAGSTWWSSTATGGFPRTVESRPRCWPSWAARGCGSWCWHLRPAGGWPGWWRTWRWLTWSAKPLAELRVSRVDVAYLVASTATTAPRAMNGAIGRLARRRPAGRATTRAPAAAMNAMSVPSTIADQPSHPR